MIGNPQWPAGKSTKRMQVFLAWRNLETLDFPHLWFTAFVRFVVKNGTSVSVIHHDSPTWDQVFLKAIPVCWLLSVGLAWFCGRLEIEVQLFCLASIWSTAWWHVNRGSNLNRSEITALKDQNRWNVQEHDCYSIEMTDSHLWIIWLFQQRETFSHCPIDTLTTQRWRWGFLKSWGSLGAWNPPWADWKPGTGHLGELGSWYITCMPSGKLSVCYWKSP
jgi:hypothetical protein